MYIKSEQWLLIIRIFVPRRLKRITRVSDWWIWISFPSQTGCVWPLWNIQDYSQPDNIPLHLPRWRPSSVQWKEKRKRNQRQVKVVPTNSEHSSGQPTPPVHRGNVDARIETPPPMQKRTGFKSWQTKNYHSLIWKWVGTQRGTCNLECLGRKDSNLNTPEKRAPTHPVPYMLSPLYSWTNFPNLPKKTPQFIIRG